MSDAERDEFLRQPWIARLAMVKPDRAPYVVPIWYEYDGASFFLVPRGRARFIDYLKANPRVALSIARDQPHPHLRVLVEGTAEIVEGPCLGGQWVEVARSMCWRYRGVEGMKYFQDTLDRPRWLVKVVPEKITSWAGRDWHPRYR